MKAQSLQFLAAANQLLNFRETLSGCGSNRSSACVLPPRLPARVRKALQQLFQRLLTVEGGTRRREGTARRVRAALRSTSAISSHRFTTSHRARVSGLSCTMLSGNHRRRSHRRRPRRPGCDNGAVVLEILGAHRKYVGVALRPVRAKAILPLQFFRWRVVLNDDGGGRCHCRGSPRRRAREPNRITRCGLK